MRSNQMPSEVAAPSSDCVETPAGVIDSSLGPNVGFGLRMYNRNACRVSGAHVATILEARVCSG